MHRKKWQFWIDRGGTFTDVVARKPDGSLIVDKLLSVNPRQYPDAAIHAIKKILGLADSEMISADEVDAVKLGTTIATNALLERTGAPTVFVTTRGFADALRIGYQNRPDIFALRIKLPEPLYELVIEARERLLADGSVLHALDEEDLLSCLLEARRAGIDSCAIAFMHAYAHPQHEKIAQALALKAGFSHVSLSSDTSPLVKFVSRGQTTVVDSYLSPVLKTYVETVSKHLGGVQLLFMQSNGGLVLGQRFCGKDSLLSGPAGGIVGAAKTCAQIGIGKIIAFDMGGTSTDVSHYNGEYERRFDSVVAGCLIRAPMMDINTVAAGGGSIVSFDDGRLRVGPESAGAFPGPACYRNGGPLTITDCNLLLGRIRTETFPPIFGETDNQPLDREIVKLKFEGLADQVNRASSTQWTVEELAERFLSIAVEKMSSAIKKVSIERGHDILDYTLCSFGGAGGQHATKIADSLALSRIVIHPLAGVLSALGIGLSEIRVLKQRSVERDLDDQIHAFLLDSIAQLEREAIADMDKQNVSSDWVNIERSVLIRYQGSDFSMPVRLTEPSLLGQQFRAAHCQRYGFISEEKPLVVEAICIEAGQIVDASQTLFDVNFKSHIGDAPPKSTVEMYSNGAWRKALLVAREHLEPSVPLEGPAIVFDPTGTTVIDPGWRAVLEPSGTLILSSLKKQEQAFSSEKDVWWQKPDPARLELFNHLFTCVAEEMGLQLQNTSHSVNIKERLDFSCAVFDGRGRLIANAPHIPVHLGSMGESVQTLIAAHKDKLKPGDSYAVNNPFSGGTHLPDITVISPVFVDASIIFFVASRGHHADIGGITPGSMPPSSTRLDQEGVVIDNFLLVRDGRFLEQEIIDLLTASVPYPVRNAVQNVADLKAQVAANARGIRGLEKLVADYPRAAVLAYMNYVRENAALAVQNALVKLKDGTFNCELDQGSSIKVSISIDRSKNRAKVDFSGTSSQVSANYNAPRAICRAAVLYVFRTLVDKDIPLNDGCLEPIEIVVPEGSLLNPRYPAAVVAGNVETSQAVTDCLYGAMGLLAASQGTMNNFTFGNEHHQYYETICGGAGAGPGFDGASAVQTHMTNSRLTDPEVLELRFPVILEEFAIRKGSGGRGRHNGGDGAVRRIRFLERMSASIISQRRVRKPFGLAGGGSGSCGLNYIVRKSGEREYLNGTATAEVEPGDVFVIETPGGGAYGAPT